MKNVFFLLLTGCISASFTLVDYNGPDKGNPEIMTTNGVYEQEADLIELRKEVIYHNACLSESGLSQAAFADAWKGYNYMLSKGLIATQQYLSICDFSQSSSDKRLYIIDIDKQQLVFNTYVAHGRNSGTSFATSFSNRPESLQSSLGFFITQNTYIGKHGLSLRLKGVEKGINDKALERTIVIHGAAYVDEKRAKTGTMMGRSWGCPAVPDKESGAIINTIKNGTCFFIYHPQKNYRQVSKILND